MFGIGLPELVVIVVVFFIFMNPKQLPSFFRKLGKVFRQMRRMREDFLQSLNGFEKGGPDDFPSKRPR